MAASPTPVPTPQALTLKATGRLDRIISDVSVCAAYDPSLPPNPVPTQTPAKALWDTGATRSVLTKEFVKALGLIAVGKTNVSHGGGEDKDVPTYMVNFVLPNQVGFVGVLVTECPSPKDGAFNVVLGMDIICIGDFAITNVGGKTCVSFRTPSSETIDYVTEIRKATGYSGVGRNAPCPCGSGKKDKKCHGANH